MTKKCTPSLLTVVNAQGLFFLHLVMSFIFLHGIRIKKENNAFFTTVEVGSIHHHLLADIGKLSVTHRKEKTHGGQYEWYSIRKLPKLSEGALRNQLTDVGRQVECVKEGDSDYVDV
jgi:hypothetical protein